MSTTAESKPRSTRTPRDTARRKQPHGDLETEHTALAIHVEQAVSRRASPSPRK